LNQQRCSFADHPPDRLFGERRATEFRNQLVGRVGEVAAGIDERAVEIENDQAPV
jgi:hypothetical protein